MAGGAMSKKSLRKTVLITGAASGIGREIAIRFAKGGWNILCHYYSSEKNAQGLRKIVNDCGTECYLLKADFSSEPEIRRFINKLKKFSVDSLINNAGTYVANKHFSKLTLKDVTDTFNVNTFVPVMITSQIFMWMKEKRFGRIVNISSIAAKYGGSAYSLHYGCSKRALEGLTKTLAREGAVDNVLVNTVRPGVIDTDFHRKFPKDMKKRIAMIPMKKIGTPQDIADIVYYLGSEKNRFITNEVITVAGGE